MSNADPEREVFLGCIAAAGVLNRSLGPLRRDAEFAVRAIGEALEAVETRDDALVLLAVLDTEITSALIDPILVVARRGRDTLRVRHLLGRLAHAAAAAVVPPAVWKLLKNAEDSDDFRRMAELLDHLGLDEALQELCVQAGDSIDEEIRAVAEDFQR